MNAEYIGSELRKLMEVGVDLTLILIGAFGINMFINQNNFVLVFLGLVWGIIFPLLIKKIQIEKSLTLRTLIGLVLVMYIPFSAISYLLYTDLLTVDDLLLIVSSMALFGGTSSLVVDLKWQRTIPLK